MGELGFEINMFEVVTHLSPCAPQALSPSAPGQFAGLDIKDCPTAWDNWK